MKSGAAHAPVATHAPSTQSWVPVWQQMVLSQQNLPGWHAIEPQQLAAGAHTLPHLRVPVGQSVPGEPTLYWLPPTRGTVPASMDEVNAMVYLNVRSNW